MPIPPEPSRFVSPVSQPRQRHIIAARVARAIAISSVVAFGACTDTTAPQKVETPIPETPTAPASLTPLGLLGASLEDETTMFLTGMHDDTDRASLERSLKSLSADLISNDVPRSAEDVAAARRLINAVDDVQQVELGPISLALEVIELALNETEK